MSEIYYKKKYKKYKEKYLKISNKIGGAVGNITGPPPPPPPQPPQPPQQPPPPQQLLQDELVVRFNQTINILDLTPGFVRTLTTPNLYVIEGMYTLPYWGLGRPRPTYRVRIRIDDTVMHNEAPIVTIIYDNILHEVVGRIIRNVDGSVDIRRYIIDVVDEFAMGPGHPPRF